MAMYYYAAFDISELSIGTITLATSGKPDVVINLGNITDTAGDSTSTTLFSHLDMTDFVGSDPSATARFQEYAANDFATALQEDLQAEATSQGWVGPSNLTCAFSPGTASYAFAYTAAFSIAWSGAVGRKLLGFSANSSSATSHSSNITPSYAISPTLQKTSDDTTNYEPTNIASRAIADSGVGYGLSRNVSPLNRDWVQQLETKEKTLRLSAASTHPWTFQHLYEHCRTVYPFVVLDGFNDEADYIAFFLREEGSAFKPERASPGNDAQFHITFKAHVEGWVS